MGLTKAQLAAQAKEAEAKAAATVEAEEKPITPAEFVAHMVAEAVTWNMAHPTKSDDPKKDGIIYKSYAQWTPLLDSGRTLAQITREALGITAEEYNKAVQDATDQNLIVQIGPAYKPYQRLTLPIYAGDQGKNGKTTRSSEVTPALMDALKRFTAK